MAEYPAIPLYTDAYLADTRHLNAAQHGAYLLLLMTAWRSPDCAIPNDDDLLARYACMDKRTWKANKTTIMRFWFLSAEQKWQQARLLDERKHAEDRRNKNAEAGRASALKRQGRHSTNVQPNFNQKATNPNPNPIIDTIEVSINERQKKKATKNDNPSGSITILLADLETITSELRDRATRHSIADIDGEWAKFRNHHLSVRSKHTRIDLCWDTWCRNAAKWQVGSNKAAGGGARQGGFKRHDHMAAATDTALADLFGIDRKRPQVGAVQQDDSACPFGNGDEAVEASYVDVGAGNKTSQQIT